MKTRVVPDLITEPEPEEDESTTLSSIENEILTNEVSASSVREDDREEDETVSAQNSKSGRNYFGRR